jgi:hypothetical protein
MNNLPKRTVPTGNINITGKVIFERTPNATARGKVSIKSNIKTCVTHPIKNKFLFEIESKFFIIKCRQPKPTAPDITMTANPVHAPAPPRYSLYPPVKIVAVTVGTIPKNKPQTLKRIDLVSNIMPGRNSHGFTIIANPMIPRIRPMGICLGEAFSSGCLKKTKS